MSYTVGLDFGTHQTKICIEDASNPVQKIYEFFEFDNLNGCKSVLFPSIVQINKDDTISYGFVDETNCKIGPNFDVKPRPILPLPDEPILELPKKPIMQPHPPKPKKTIKSSSLGEAFRYQENYNRYIDEWEKQCKTIDKENIQKNQDWELDCLGIKNDYNYDLENYHSMKKAIELKNIESEKWNKDILKRKQIFRYFKLATFSNQNWEYDINPEIISVWYLTFILFKLQEKYGCEFYTQMGYPHSISTNLVKKQQDIAYKILVSANFLVTEYKNLDSFLKEKYTDLKNKTELWDYTRQEIIDYGINVLPEAFAGLTSVSQQKKLPDGMHLLADIGGGTTDIAFFSIIKDELADIHAVISFPQGLNYIFEEYQKSQEGALLSIAEIQKLFRVTRDGFINSVASYHNRLRNETDTMIRHIENKFLAKQHVHLIDIRELKKALEDRPVIFCGGGSTYDAMLIPLATFTDKILLNKDLLGISYIKNDNIETSLFTILATSYGLSLQSENDISMTPIEKFFDYLPPKEPGKSDKPDEYGLVST